MAAIFRCVNTASIGNYVDLVDAREKLEDRIGKWPAVLVALVKVLRESRPDAAAGIVLASRLSSAQPQAAPQSAVAPMAPPPMMAPPMPPPPVAPPPMPVAPPMGQPPMMANLPPQLLAFIQSQAQRQPMPAMPVIDPRIRY